jgi:hypothetical protein
MPVVLGTSDLGEASSGRPDYSGLLLQYDRGGPKKRGGANLIVGGSRADYFTNFVMRPHLFQS